MRTVYSKVLLFGEYTVLQGSSALAVPCKNYSVTLDFIKPETNHHAHSASNETLQQFLKFLLQIRTKLHCHFNITRFESDVFSGLYLKSTIPQKYGLGSSGALVAILFQEYAIYDSLPSLLLVKNDLALAESYFHGKSSGMDPLCCYLGTGIYKKGHTIKKVPVKNIESVLCFFSLFDTGIKSSTKNLVNGFLNELRNSESQIEFDRHIEDVNAIIAEVSSADVYQVERRMKQISQFQFNHYRHLIPESVLSLWRNGLNSGNYYMKLCGSGGGGNMIVFSKFSSQQLHSRFNLKTNLILS